MTENWNYHEPKRTHIKHEEAHDSLRWALGYPKDNITCLAMAKSALETGQWASMWNHNFGNVKAGSKWSGGFTCITLNELEDGRLIWYAPGGQLKGGPGTPIVGVRHEVPPGHPQTRMRAFANRYDGAEQYIEALQRLFPRSYSALTGGATPSEFVHQLKLERYFTAEESPYAKAVEKLYAQFMGKSASLSAAELCEAQRCVSRSIDDMIIYRFYDESEAMTA